jgi:hypothetical protein
MKVKNNYDECLTNLACSIRKNFNLEYHHKTIVDIDNILAKNYKNVVLILFDGMGSNILDRVLPKDSFFIKNRIKKITSVFPATTVAATTSITTGLNPVETGMLGWNIYYKDLDKVITTYLDVEKGDPAKKILPEAIAYKKKYMKTTPITKSINAIGKSEGYSLFPFGTNPYNNLDDMLLKIEKICSQTDNKRHFVYAYDIEPDHTMHEIGCDTEEVTELIKERNDKVATLCNNLHDTVVFVVADHGHINVDNIFLNDYPDIMECLERNTSIDARAVNFFIKKGKKTYFKELFNKYFSKDFKLYTKEDVIASKLFGDGLENEKFRDALGDYLAIAYTNKTLLNTGDDVLKSQHAGYTADEIYVPLIVKEMK